MVTTVPSTTVSPQTGRLLFVDEVQADSSPGRIQYLMDITRETPPPERQVEEESEEESEEQRDEEEEARARERAPLTSAELERFRMVMEQERQEMEEEVATNNGPLGIRNNHSNRTQDLEMIASHANVESLNLPPDLIALAYDRNNGELIDTFMNLTEPAIRRELERELAERRERRSHSVHHPAPWDSAVGAVLSDRSYAHQVHHGEEEEEEPPDARELDLWLLESQVPGCTRERAERAYEQSNEDVSRALPLARMGTLLADRDAMIVFLREQHHQATLEDAEVSYEFMDGDVIEAAAHMVRGIRWRANESALSARRMHTVRLRTVFHLALLYRERYRMEPDEDTLPAGTAVRAFTATAEEAVRQGLVRARPAPDREGAEEEPSVEQRAALDFTAARFAMFRPSSAATLRPSSAAAPAPAPAAAPDAVAELNETLATDAVATRERLLAALQRANGPPERPPEFHGPTGTPWRYTRERGWTRVSDEERADVVLAASAERERRFQQHQVRTSWGAPTVGELRQQFEERVARAAREDANLPLGRALRPEAFAREFPLVAWSSAQRARDQELQQLRRRLAETEHWPEGQVFIRNRLRTLLTETLVAHAEREQILGRQVDLEPPWAVVLQTVRRWDGRGTSEADVREVLDDAARLRRQALGAAGVVPAAPANGGRLFYREDEDDPIEDASETESDLGSPIPVRLASASSSGSEDEAHAAEFRTPSAARQREIVMASRGGWPHAARVTRMGRAIHPAPLPSPPFHERIKQSLRVVQERVDAEMASAALGEVFSEGAYLDIMNSIKGIWEAVDMAFVV